MMKKNRHEKSQVKSKMRADWNLRANDNPIYAIDSTKVNQSLLEFFDHGKEIVSAALDPTLQRLNINPESLRVLEIGCGIGRLFEGLSMRFGEVWGIDVSQAMIDLGERSCPVEAKWILGDGSSLDGIPSNSIDYVFSWEVFQHIPDQSIIEDYFHEIYRVLLPGAVFQVQLRKGSDRFGQSVFRKFPRPLRVAAGKILQRFGQLPVKGDVDTWLGIRIPAESALSMARTMNFTECQIQEDEIHPAGLGYWLVGKKPLS